MTPTPPPKKGLSPISVGSASFVNVNQEIVQVIGEIKECLSAKRGGSKWVEAFASLLLIRMSEGSKFAKT